MQWGGAWNIFFNILNGLVLPGPLKWDHIIIMHTDKLDLISRIVSEADKVNNYLWSKLIKDKNTSYSTAQLSCSKTAIMSAGIAVKDCEDSVSILRKETMISEVKK